MRDAECSELVEDIRPADMMAEFLMPGETEVLSLRVVSMNGGPVGMVRPQAIRSLLVIYVSISQIACG